MRGGGGVREEQWVEWGGRGSEWGGGGEDEEE